MTISLLITSCKVREPLIFSRIASPVEFKFSNTTFPSCSVMIMSLSASTSSTVRKPPFFISLTCASSRITPPMYSDTIKSPPERFAPITVTLPDPLFTFIPPVSVVGVQFPLFALISTSPSCSCTNKLPRKELHN